MKIFGIVALSVGAVVLSACGGSSHATCKDEASTMAYAQKWSEDLQAAAMAGKIDPAKAISDLNAQRTALDAILKTYSEISGMTLFSYLR